MQREKNGHIYYTLIGGRIDKSETKEEAIVREVKEETSLDVTQMKLVYIEDHPKPYSAQYTFLCDVAKFNKVKLQDNSEEAIMNKLGINIHTPMWIDLKLFPNLPFRTVQLQNAIVKDLSKGFQDKPIYL